MREKKSVPSKENLEQAYIGYRMTQKQLAKHFHVSTVTVCRWLKQYGITKKSARLDVPSKRVLQVMYGTGMSQRQIGARFKVSSVDVGCWLREYGIVPDMRNKLSRVSKCTDIGTVSVCNTKLSGLVNDGANLDMSRHYTFMRCIENIRLFGKVKESDNIFICCIKRIISMVTKLVMR